MPDPLLQDMVRIVSEARSRAAIAKLVLMAKQEQFKRDQAALYQEDSDARIVLETAEAALRTAAKEHVDAHKGVTSGLPVGVGARKGVDLDYDTRLAFEWAKQTGIGLILDTKAFEVIAKNSELPFVTKTPTITITLAKDLSKAVAVAEVTAPVAPTPAPVAAASTTEEDPF